MKKVFLGGPITHYLKDNIFDCKGEKIFRQAAYLLQSCGFEVFSAHLLEDFGRVAKEKDDVLTKRDLSWIDMSDICVFIFPVQNDGLPIRTDGTYIELGYSVASKKNILIFWEPNAYQYYSPMLRGVSELGATFHLLNEMKEVLINLG